MKASELRLGNYVDYNCCCENKITVKVESISKDKLWMIDDTKNYHCTKCGETFYNNLIDFFYPIPLTEEWLLKFGFVKHFNMFIKSYSRNEDNMVSFLGIFFEEKINSWIGYVGNNNTNFSVAINCYFSVHQIQNLYFSLTGEEMILKT